MKLYTIADQLRSAINDVESGELSPDFMADTIDALDLEFKDKVEATAAYRRELQLISEGADKEIKRLQSRKKALDNKVEWAEDYLRYNMEKTGIGKVEGALFDVTLGKPSQIVYVDDVDLLPESMTRTTVAADKTAIKKALVAGEEISGAVLVLGKAKLIIK